MATQRRGRAVFSPNLGLYLGMPPLLVPERGMTDCMNVRIRDNKVVHDNLGWMSFPDDPNAINLDNKSVMLIDTFTPRGGVERTIFANTTDLFVYDDANKVVEYLTPRVESGTVDVSDGSAIVTGNSTTWTSDLKAGDFIHVGATGEVSQAVSWYEIASVDSDTQLTLTESFNENGRFGAGEPYTARSTFTGDIRDGFIAEPFFGASSVQGTDGDRLYITNGVDPVVAWDGIADQVYVPDLGNVDTCRSMKRYKNIMVFIAPTLGGSFEPFRVRTSNIGEPENTVSGSAGEFVIHDGADELLTAMQIGEQLAIYGERSVTTAQFVGGSLVFVFRTAVAGFGPRSVRAVAQFPDHHLFIGADAQYLFDGVAARPVNGHVWRDVIRQTSPQRLDFIQAQFDEENGELLWIVPLNTDPDPENGAAQTAFVMHYLEDVGQNNPTPHTKRYLPATTFGFFQRPTTLTWAQISERWHEFNYRWNDQFLQAAFPQVVFGDANGNLFLLNEGATADGADMDAYARFSRRPLGNNPAQKGFIRRVYPFVEHLPTAEHDIRVRVRKANRADEISSLASDLPFAVNGEGIKHFVSPRVVSRYVEIEFATEGVTDYWAISGYDLDVVKAGER